MSNLITPKEALHQSSWQIIAKRFDLDDISTTRSLLEEAHRIILEQDMLVESQDILIEMYRGKVDISKNVVKEILD
jgi:hypothetical protein